jgi:hypothetical protein
LDRGEPVRPVQTHRKRGDFAGQHGVVGTAERDLDLTTVEVAGLDSVAPRSRKVLQPRHRHRDSDRPARRIGPVGGNIQSTVRDRGLDHRQNIFVAPKRQRGRPPDDQRQFKGPVEVDCRDRGNRPFVGRLPAIADDLALTGDDCRLGFRRPAERRQRRKQEDRRRRKANT